MPLTTPAADPLLPTPPTLRREHALFVDFDGTLVEFASSPSRVQVPPELPRLLTAALSFLAGAAAIVSGRSLEDLGQRLAPFAGTMVGQHGLECRRMNGIVIRWPAEPTLSRIRTTLANFAALHQGVTLEDKGCTIALHYRNAPAFAVECVSVARRAALDSGGAFEVMDGRMVVELVPSCAGKGGAIAALLAEQPFHGRVPVFVGDDTGDEEGFSVINRLGGLSIHVGAGATTAHYRLATPGDVFAWLSRSVDG